MIEPRTKDFRQDFSLILTLKGGTALRLKHRLSLKDIRAVVPESIIHESSFLYFFQSFCSFANNKM